jgi:hypothetical protein
MPTPTTVLASTSLPNASLRDLGLILPDKHFPALVRRDVVSSRIARPGAHWTSTYFCPAVSIQYCTFGCYLIYLNHSDLTVNVRSSFQL